MILPICVAFRQGLQEAGYVEGQNVAIEYRLGGGDVRAIAGLRGRIWFAVRSTVIASDWTLAAVAAQKRRPRRFRSSSRTVADPVGSASSPALPGRAAMSQVLSSGR